MVFNKKFLIIVFLTINIIGLVILILMSANSVKYNDADISYKTLSKDSIEKSETLLAYEEQGINSFANQRVVSINEKHAIMLAHLLVLKKHEDELKQPYYVYSDDEHNVYIILAETKDRNGAYKVIISKNNGGILYVLFALRASVNEIK